MRAKVLLTAVAVLVALAGCTSPSDDDRREPAAARQTGTSSSVEPSPPESTAFVGRRSPLVQDLWRPVGDLPPLRTVLPGGLRFDKIQQAPLLHEAPINLAVLAVGTVPQPYSVGEVAVMGPGGEWRIVNRESVGMRNADIVEQQFMLSPNGRLLALGDEFGVVVVELATGTAVRIKVPAKDPVLHWWSPDSTSLVLTPRGGTKRALAIRVVDRVVERVGYHAWSSLPGAPDRVAELVPNPRSAEEDRLASGDAYSAIQHWRADQETTYVSLEHAISSDARVGGQWSSWIGVVQGAYPEGQQSARGVLAVDPATGRTGGLLALTPRQIVWASVGGALDDRWLLLQLTFGPGGGLVAWDPVAAQLRGVLPIDEQAANVSIAMGLVSDSLR